MFGALVPGRRPFEAPQMRKSRLRVVVTPPSPVCRRLAGGSGLKPSVSLAAALRGRRLVLSVTLSIRTA